MAKKRKIKVELPPEEYEKANLYLEKLTEAESLIELNYYYKKVTKIIENSLNIEDGSNEKCSSNEMNEDNTDF